MGGGAEVGVGEAAGGLVRVRAGDDGAGPRAPGRRGRGRHGPSAADPFVGGAAGGAGVDAETGRQEEAPPPVRQPPQHALRGVRNPGVGADPGRRRGRIVRPGLPRFRGQALGHGQADRRAGGAVQGPGERALDERGPPQRIGRVFPARVFDQGGWLVLLREQARDPEKNDWLWGPEPGSAASGVRNEDRDGFGFWWSHHPAGRLKKVWDRVDDAREGQALLGILRSVPKAERSAAAPPRGCPWTRRACWP